MEGIAVATTPEDIAYVRSEFATLAELTCDRGSPAWAGTLLPRATYQLPDGELRFARDWRQLADDAGSVSGVRALFDRRLAAASHALEHAVDPGEEWEAYLAGLYGACLYTVTPEHIVAKARLIDRIDRTLVTPRPADRAWRRALHTDVDALDAITRPFATCDRARFGRPTSRDRLIAAVRTAYPEAE